MSLSFRKQAVLTASRPLQICALRDGAHGEIEAGIHGQVGKGAYSIALSSGGYADVDEGDFIKYCGTAGSDCQPTAATLLLKESVKFRTPVRVLRSAALPASSKYRPAKGLRYDGLYEMVGDPEVLDDETAMHRFTLRRRAGQNPIRYQGAETRPTIEELEADASRRKLEKGDA